METVEEIQAGFDRRPGGTHEWLWSCWTTHLSPLISGHQLKAVTLTWINKNGERYRDSYGCTVSSIFLNIPNFTGNGLLAAIGRELSSGIMKIQNHYFRAPNYHCWRYYCSFVKMCWKCSIITETYHAFHCGITNHSLNYWRCEISELKQHSRCYIFKWNHKCAVYMKTEGSLRMLQ